MRNLTWMISGALVFGAPGWVAAQPTPEAPDTPAGDETPSAAESWEASADEGAADERASTAPDGATVSAAPESSPTAAAPETKPDADAERDTDAPLVEPLADEADEPPVRPPGLDALGSHQDHFWIDMGVRTSFVNDSGLDPFAYDDALVQFSLGGGRTVFSSGSVSVALGLAYEVGSKTADARGDTTSLLVHRALFAPELRNHLWARMYVFVQPAVGLLRTRASLDDTASGATLESKKWAGAFDLTAGAAYQIAGAPSGEGASPRLWFSAEGGYGWGRKVHLEMSPDDDSVGPERIAPRDLGDLTLRGPTFSLRATLSY